MNDNLVLDKIDHKILACLLNDARCSFSQIARDVSLTDVAIKKRVERLKMKGVITSFSTDLNLKVLGYENPIFIQIRSEMQKNKDVLKKLSSIDAIVELYQVLGEYNLLAKIIIPSIDSSKDFIQELQKIDGIVDIKSQVILCTEKKANSLPAQSLQKKL